MEESLCGVVALFISSLTLPPKYARKLWVRMVKRMVSCLVVLLISFVIVDAKHRAEPISADEDSMCASCLEVSRKAVEGLSDPKLFEKVGMLSSEVCHILPTNLEAKCLETSGSYMSQTQLFLQEFFHEKSLCSNTGLCLDKSKFPVDNDLVIENKIANELEDERDCLTCRRAVRDLKIRLKQSKMRVKITETLLEYCEEADENEEHCKQTVYRYVPLVLSKLDKLKPGNLCLMIGMCGEEISM